MVDSTYARQYIYINCLFNHLFYRLFMYWYKFGSRNIFLSLYSAVVNVNIYNIFIFY